MSSGDQRHRRPVDFRDFSSMLADIEDVHRRGYQRAGEWNLTMILNHVGTGFTTAMDGFEKKWPWLFRRLIGPTMLKGILKKRRMAAGIKVPKWWLPGPADDETQAIEAFRQLVQRFEKHSGPLHEHPFFGRLDREAWKQLILVHGSHHLSFLVPKPAESASRA